MTRRLPWTLAVALGVVGAAGVALLDRDPTGQLLYAGVGAAAVIAALAGAARWPAALRGRGVSVAAGMAVWWAGDAYLVLVQPVGTAHAVANLMQLVGSLMLLVMLARYVHRREESNHAEVILDGLVGAVGWAYALVVLVVWESWGDTGPTVAQGLQALLLVVGVVVTAILAGHCARVSNTPAADVLLLVAVVLVLTSSVGFLSADRFTWLDGHRALLDAGILLGYAVVAAAMLAGPGRAPAVARDPAEALSSRAVVATMASALALPASLLALGTRPPAALVLGVVLMQVLLVVLIGVRLARMVGQSSRLALEVTTTAQSDPLTGLPNAAHFARAVDGALSGGQSAAVLLVGFENHHELQQTLGRRAGDELLLAASRRVVELMPDARCVAHLANDVFGVLLADPTSDLLLDRGRRVVDAFRRPLQLTQLSLDLRAAVGVATPLDEPVTGQELVANADLALSVARGDDERVVRFESELERRDGLSAQLIGELPDAITRRELVVHFQPQVDLSTGQVIGAEALVRWMHPSLGLLAPGAFVPAAEATGAIRLVTLHVLDQALGWCAAWEHAGRAVTVAVNLSARDLLHASLVDDVRAALERHAVTPRRLELEITETIAMADINLSRRVLTDLARLGVTISVDDYGTGYGSLAYLQQLPVRRLKIDRSFVSRVLDDEASSAIVRSTIELAAQLGMDAVAEGVEDDATLALLQQLECAIAQGFGLAAPMPPEGFEPAAARLEQRLRSAQASSVRPSSGPERIAAGGLSRRDLRAGSRPPAVAALPGPRRSH